MMNPKREKQYVVFPKLRFSHSVLCSVVVPATYFGNSALKNDKPIID